jgi:hypothetical protein
MLAFGLIMGFLGGCLLAFAYRSLPPQQRELTLFGVVVAWLIPRWFLSNAFDVVYIVSLVSAFAVSFGVGGWLLPAIYHRSCLKR